MFGQFGKMNFGRGRRLGLSFNPASLFGSGEQGVWMDLSDMSTLFSDSGGTTPAAVDGPVGMAMDKSGNDNHLIQTDNAKRPTLKEDGAGNRYLSFNGGGLKAAFTIAQPFDRVSVLRQVPGFWYQGGGLLHGVTADTGTLTQFGGEPNFALWDGSGLLQGVVPVAMGTSMLVRERHDNTASRLGVNAEADVVGTTGDTLPGGLTIGTNYNETNPTTCDIYSVLMIDRPLLSDEMDQLIADMTAKSDLVF